MIKPSIALITATMTATIFLSACTPKPEAKTVAYYLANEAERHQVSDKCRNNPGELKDDPDCINAAEAMHKAQAYKVPKAVPYK